VITGLAALKDDAMVVMARLDRIDATAQKPGGRGPGHAQPPRAAGETVERLEERTQPDG
jgi:hypothetical protein